MAIAARSGGQTDVLSLLLDLGGALAFPMTALRANFLASWYECSSSLFETLVSFDPIYNIILG